VADLERSRRFYEEGLGWRRTGAHPEVVFFQAGGMVVGLFGRDDLAKDAQVAPEGAGFRALSLGYNARSREEADSVMAEAEAAGASIPKPAGDTFWGGYAGYFADPDGHLWEVAWNPEWPMAADGSIRLPY
ncbi:MAG TPA: VOC family protein, partial [Geminicoccaceae bacterium]